MIYFILALLLSPCPSEDSNFCQWDAQTQGNGLGQSFVALSGNWIVTQ